MRWGAASVSLTLVFVLSAPAAAELCSPVSAHFSAHPASVGAAHTCAQDYPALALRNYEEGDVDVEFMIKADGTVRSPRIRRTSGYADLDHAAVDCVLRFTYRPAIQNGKPIEVPWTTRVRFRLADWQSYAAAPAPKTAAPRKAVKHAKPDRHCIPIAALPEIHGARFSMMLGSIALGQPFRRAF